MPIDAARLNAIGDVVLTEPDEIRALADPLRLTLFELVRRHGPVTSAALAEWTDESAAVVDDRLRMLASCGLVDETGGDRGPVEWTTEAKGIYFEIPNEPEAARAARELSNVMLTRYAALPAAWVREQEPRLGLEWARAAGLFNARVALTSDELRSLQESLERFLEPFAKRSPTDTPSDAATVRVLAYFLPEAEHSDPTGA